MALRVMKSESVEIDDLAGLMAKNLPLAAGDMFHWKAPGVALLTESVTKSIASALEKTAGEVAIAEEFRFAEFSTPRRIMRDLGGYEESRPEPTIDLRKMP